MRKEKMHNQKLLGLAERPETRNAEIYAPTGIPTENALPAYTQTQTSPQHISFAPTSPARLTDLSMAELLELPKTEWGIYYSEVQETYQEAIENNKSKLKRWEQSMLLTDGHMPTPTDYDKKIQHLLGKLPAIDFDDGEPSKKVPLKYLFPTSSENKDTCGLYLIINGCSLENVVLLSGIQWLMGQRDALLMKQPSTSAEEKPQPPVNEDAKALDEDTALLYQLMKHNYLNDEGKPHNPVYVLGAIRDFLRRREIQWAACCSHFTQKLHDEKLTPKTAGALAKDMTRELSELKIENTRDYINMHDLQLSDLKKNQMSEKAAKHLFNQFKAIYAQVENCAKEFLAETKLKITQRQSKDTETNKDTKTDKVQKH